MMEVNDFLVEGLRNAALDFQITLTDIDPAVSGRQASSLPRGRNAGVDSSGRSGSGHRVFGNSADGDFDDSGFDRLISGVGLHCRFPGACYSGFRFFSGMVRVSGGQIALRTKAKEEEPQRRGHIAS